jgi:hypothetical protein
MTNDTPIACALGAGELKQRLATIAAIGADSLLSHDVEDGDHLLRFRASAETRQRLEEIVAAEAKCCSFLDLSLSDERGELILSITAPQEAQALAGELAAAFSRALRHQECENYTAEPA